MECRDAVRYLHREGAGPEEIFDALTENPTNWELTRKLLRNMVVALPNSGCVVELLPARFGIHPVSLALAAQAPEDLYELCWRLELARSCPVRWDADYGYACGFSTVERRPLVLYGVAMAVGSELKGRPGARLTLPGLRLGDHGLLAECDLPGAEAEVDVLHLSGRIREGRICVRKRLVTSGPTDLRELEALTIQGEHIHLTSFGGSPRELRVRADHSTKVTFRDRAAA